MPTFILLSRSGFISTRTAGRELPPTKTWPMPSIWAIFCARMESPTSYICGCVMTSEVMAGIMIGASAGLTLRQFGFDGRFAGSSPRAALMAACTSRAAASMSRSRSNCRVMLVEPEELFDVICVTPAMRPNCRSSGVATAEAIVSGFAPGRLAETETVGNSTCGSGATGSLGWAGAPAIRTAAVSSEVATGRRMKGTETLIRAAPRRLQNGECRMQNEPFGASNSAFCIQHSAFRSRLRGHRIPHVYAPPQPLRELVEPQIDDRRRVQRQQLADQQAADDGHAERVAQLGAGGAAEGQRQAARKRGERRPHGPGEGAEGPL